MNLWVLGLLFCVFTSGCVSLQIIPDKSALPSIRTISVVPIEGPPLILHPVTQDDRIAFNSLRSIKVPSTVLAERVSEPGGSLLQMAAQLYSYPDITTFAAAGGLAIVGCTILLTEAGRAGKEVPGETAILERGHPGEIWASGEFAKTAVITLQHEGFRDVRLIAGYVKLPITDRSNTWHMEHWLAPIRRFYNSQKSTVEYADVGSDHADAILEVGVMNYEYFSERLVLQVFVRLIDPRTKQVLGRVRNSFSSETGSLAPLLYDDAEGLARLIVETGNRLLVKCLVEIGLSSK